MPTLSRNTDGASHHDGMPLPPKAEAEMVSATRNVSADARMNYILAESRTFNLTNIIGYIKGVGIYHKV